MPHFACDARRVLGGWVAHPAVVVATGEICGMRVGAGAPPFPDPVGADAAWASIARAEFCELFAGVTTAGWRTDTAPPFGAGV